MIIGFIGFGKVSQTLFSLLKSGGITCVTSSQDRSFKTRENIENSGIDVLDCLKDVARKSDILISAASPKSSLEIAREYGKYCSGIYLDLNNISPDTTSQIAGLVDNFVDGAIIGKIDSDNPVLYISGKKADDLLFLGEFIETRKISDDAGDAAILKMLRSSYTKTLSALLIESSEIAKKYGLEDEFFDTLAVTEGNDFRQKSISRINNTVSGYKRKSEELEEIINYFDDSDLTMVKSALKKLNRYSH